MTPQEAQMLQDLVRKIQQTQLTEKDPDAEALLIDGLNRDPDALYKLAQTVVVQNLALNQARMQIEQLRQQAVPAAPARASTFLGSLLGHHEPVVPPAPSIPPPPPYQEAPPPPYSEPAPSGAGSFLRSAATTAAGVAAGALAFQGVESLLHGFGHSSGIGEFGGFGTPVAGAPAEETVINNYYDNPADQFDHREHEAALDDDRVRSSDLQSQGQSENDRGRLEDASFDRDSDSNSDSVNGDDYQDDQQSDGSDFDDGGGDDLV
jgi:uncharacterized protein